MTVLYGVNLWLTPIPATAARMELPSVGLLWLLLGLSDPRISQLRKSEGVSALHCIKTQMYDRLRVIPL